MVKEKEIKEKIKKKMHEPREIYWKHPFEEKKSIEKVKGWLKTLAPELGNYYDEYWEGMVDNFSSISIKYIKFLSIIFKIKNK